MGSCVFFLGNLKKGGGLFEAPLRYIAVGCNILPFDPIATKNY